MKSSLSLGFGWVVQYKNQSSLISALQGGVGKTTSTFLLASHFAHKNPGTRVLVVDMCPQANVSSALLGKGQNMVSVGTYFRRELCDCEAFNRPVAQTWENIQIFLTLIA